MFVANCATGDQGPTLAPTPSPAPSVSASVPRETSSPASKCAQSSGGTEASLVDLLEVRTGSHDAFDRLVFEFKQVEGTGLPVYEVKEATPPFTETSGREIQVSGAVYANALVRGSRDSDDLGNQTYTGPTEIRPGLPIITEVQQVDQFEAVSDWVIGLTERGCWQVSEFLDPLRLVIDFARLN